MPVEVIELQEDAAIAKRIYEDKYDGVRKWKISGTFLEAEAFDALAVEVPSTIDGGDDDTLYLDKIECKSDEADLWDGTAFYISEVAKNEKEQKQKDQKPEDGIVWDFDTTGATHHITSSFETRVFGGPGGPQNELFTAYSNAINVKRTKTGFDVKGVDVVIPALEITGTLAYPNGSITIEWIKDIARATGKTNSTPWSAFDAGELLFKGARIKAKQWDKTTVVFTFSASENITEAHQFKIGEIGPIIKPGHAYVWVEYENVDINGPEGVRIFPKARYAYVEKLYRSFDFNELEI